MKSQPGKPTTVPVSSLYFMTATGSSPVAVVDAALGVADGEDARAILVQQFGGDAAGVAESLHRDGGLRQRDALQLAGAHGW